MRVDTTGARIAQYLYKGYLRMSGMCAHAHTTHITCKKVRHSKTLQIVQQDVTCRNFPVVTRSTAEENALEVNNK